MSRILYCLIIAGIILAANHRTPINTKIMGQKIYLERCKTCHGVQGDGKTFAANVLFPPPRNFIEKNNVSKLTFKRMIRSVTEGRPNTAMMAWKEVLTKQEIHSVVLYTRKELMRLKE